MKKLILIFTVFSIFQFYSQEVSITDIEVKNKKIFIEYELTGNNSCEIQLYYRSKSDYTWIGPLKKLDGDFGKKIKAGNKKLITWNTLDEVDYFSGEYQFGIEVISNKTEKKIKEPKQNSYDNFSYNSFSLLNFFDIISGGYVTPYIAWPYACRQFYSYPNQEYQNIPLCLTLGSSYVKSNSEWEYGIDLSFVFGSSENVTWFDYDGINEYSANHKYFQTRLLARANYLLLENKLYLGLGLGVKLIKEKSKSNINEYNNTLRTFRPAARLVVGGRYDNGFNWEIGFGGGGAMIGYSFYI